MRFFLSQLLFFSTIFLIPAISQAQVVESGTGTITASSYPSLVGMTLPYADIFYPQGPVIQSFIFGPAHFHQPPCDINRNGNTYTIECDGEWAQIVVDQKHDFDGGN